MKMQEKTTQIKVMILGDRLAVILFVLFSLGCARTNEITISRPGARLTSKQKISDNISLGIVSKASSFQYEVEENDSSRILATGESAITSLDFVDGLFRGTQDVINIPGGSFVVREDVSDAAVAVRYIYFERTDDGLFNVSYLDLPFYSRMDHGLPTEAPYIVPKSRKIWSLLYLPSRRKINVDVESVKKSRIPLTVQ